MCEHILHILCVFVEHERLCSGPGDGTLGIKSALSSMVIRSCAFELAWPDPVCIGTPRRALCWGVLHLGLLYFWRYYKSLRNDTIEQPTSNTTQARSQVYSCGGRSGHDEAAPSAGCSAMPLCVCASVPAVCVPDTAAGRVARVPTAPGVHCCPLNQ